MKWAFQTIWFNLNHRLKCPRYTQKMTSPFVMQPSILNAHSSPQFHVKGTLYTSSGHWQANVSHVQGCGSPPFNTVSLFCSSFQRQRNITQLIQQSEMETGLAFWSWFNLAVTPIAVALKWLRRIVSAWWDLQLGGTSAPAAAPEHPLNLQIWHAQSLALVGSQHKQFPHCITVNNFMRWISTGQLDGFQLWIFQERHAFNI